MFSCKLIWILLFKNSWLYNFFFTYIFSIVCVLHFYIDIAMRYCITKTILLYVFTKKVLLLNLIKHIMFSLSIWLINIFSNLFSIVCFFLFAKFNLIFKLIYFKLNNHFIQNFFWHMCMHTFSLSECTPFLNSFCIISFKCKYKFIISFHLSRSFDMYYEPFPFCTLNYVYLLFFTFA